MTPGGLGYLNWFVVVTVVAVRMMQAPLNQVVDVIPVSNRFVTTTIINIIYNQAPIINIIKVIFKGRTFAIY